MKSTRGFTLIEVMVVTTIIAILTGLLVVGMNAARKSSRDAERQADLRTLQNAIELYKAKYGRYPAGCKGYGTWSGESGSYACSSGNEYIVGLVPEFMSELPTDPKLNTSVSESGYAYWPDADYNNTPGNDAGEAYKLMVLKTVESETVTSAHEFMSCDWEGVCGSVYFNSNNVAPNCDPSHSSLTFETSYAVWGGYPFEPFSQPARREEQQENTICRMPS